MRLLIGRKGLEIAQCIEAHRDRMGQRLPTVEGERIGLAKLFLFEQP